MPPAVEAWSLNHWTTSGVPVALFKIHCHLGEKIQGPYKPRGSLVSYFCQQEQDVAFFTFQVLQFQCTRQRRCRSIRQAVLSMGQKNGGWGVDAREASEGQLACSCNLQRRSSSGL